MADLSRIVSVSVSTSAAAVKQANFGIPMVLGYHTVHGDKVRTYANMTEVVVDHPEATNPGIYKACAAIFAQSPQVEEVKVGRLANAPTMEFHIVPTAVNSTVYKLNVIGTNAGSGTASYTSDASATVAEITAGLQAAIAALSLTGITATDQATHVKVVGTAGGWISCSPEFESLLDVRQAHAATLTSGDLDLVLAADQDWYCILNTTSSCQTTNTFSATFANDTYGASTSDNGILAAWALANKKLAFLQIQGNGMLSSSTAQFNHLLNAAANDYAAALYHRKPEEMAHAAWVGATMGLDPGSETFMFKQLAGITADVLTATQVTNVENDNGNYYVTFGGTAITAKGTVSGGEYIDVTRDSDWLQARLQERIANLLINNAKVPFTDKGIAMVEAELRAQLREAIDAGFLAESPAPVITVPRASAVSAGNKAIRNLTGVQADCTLANAIHKVTLSVNITL